MSSGSAIVTGHKNFKNIAGSGPEEGTLQFYEHVYVLSNKSYESVVETVSGYENCSVEEKFHKENFLVRSERRGNFL